MPKRITVTLTKNQLFFTIVAIDHGLDQKDAFARRLKAKYEKALAQAKVNVT